MKHHHTLVLLFCCALAIPAHAQVELFLKARGTGFTAEFGNYYSGIGYEFGASLKASAKPWVGGIHLSRAMLEEIPASSYNTAVAVNMNHYNLHYGLKGALWKVLYPYAYAVAGFRTVSYKEAQRTETDPIFNSLSLGYGLKSGVQLGGRRWRGELSLEYASGTPARYLNQATFERANAAHTEVHKVAGRSPMSSFTVGAGVVYVVDFVNRE